MFTVMAPPDDRANGGAGDLCIRCHSTTGWLGGRSTPTDGSGLAASDSDGVDCDFCHKLTNPDDSEHLGVMNPGFVANEVNAEDQFDGAVDWDSDNPAVPDQNPGNGIEGYYGSGMASMWAGSDKLGPYNDADARHQFMQSKFHRDRDFCGSCHDVSNPAVGNLAHNHGAQAIADPVVANGVLGGTVDGKAAFNNPPYKYGIVERTFSEYKAGQISQTLVENYSSLPADLQGGALEAAYNAATKEGTIDPNYQNPSMPRYFSCQTCHMRPLTGTGANKNSVPVRDDLPLHDMTGGNYWMPEAIAYLNAQGKLLLGGSMSDYQVQAMLDGALRAKEQLELAATLSVDSNGNSVKIINHTGHKLISGYPEGRRMWLNIKWYDSAGTLIREDGEYGELEVDLDADAQPETTIRTILDLKGTNTRIYEAHMGMTQEWAAALVGLGYDPGLPLTYNRVTGVPDFTLGDLAGSAPDTEHETFHFVLNNTVVKDNRIPPYGMNYEIARVRNALPVPDTQYSGGPTFDYFDEVNLNRPSNAQSAKISLLYQPTSWEYIQFLYLANKGTDPTNGGNAFLGEEGINMLDAWLNAGKPDDPEDQDVSMAEPYVMASTSWGTPPGECDATTPTLLTTSPGDKQVSLSWEEISGDGYKLYYDQSGKAQLITDLQCSSCDSYIDTGDTGLTNGQEYCYKITSYNNACESGFSNILCAIPTQPGQAVEAGVVEPLQTGKWIKQGKGKNATTEFVLTDTFVQGDAVVIQATIKDEGGTPVSDAIITLTISGPETVSPTSGPSDANGVVEVTWSTQAPNKKGQGGTTTGGYSVTITGMTASGFVWDQVPTSTTFTITGQ